MQTRREFLERTGAAAAGALAASRFAWTEPSGRKIRVGIVGGHFGCSFHFAHQSALKGGVQMQVPSFDPA